MYREIKRRNFALVTSLTINFQKKKTSLTINFLKKNTKLKEVHLISKMGSLITGDNNIIQKTEA